MNDPFLEQLLRLDGPFFEGALVLCCSILLARLAPLPREMQPAVWFQQLALKLAHKVNHIDRSPQQQRIAGLLATLLLILPFWTILTLLLELAAFPWFFEFVIIYLCLSDVSFTQVALEVTEAIGRQDKVRAKSQLSQWMSRDTQELSEVGLSKATIETLATSPVYGTVATIVFFSIAGAPLVLAVRMIMQLALSWPRLNPRYRHFSHYVTGLGALLLSIPGILWALTLAIQGGPRAILALFSAPKGRVPLATSGLCVHIMATILRIELGGPQKFAGHKIEVDRLNYGPLPKAEHISQAIALSTRGCIIWFCALVLIPIIWAGLRYTQFHH